MSDPRWTFKRPLAEFVAIFAGVTLSLLADDWRQSRDDARDEVAALELIHADLVRDTVEFSFALGPVRGHERSTVWLLQRWDDPAVPTDSLMAALRSYVIYNSYDFQNAAYSSLKESNRLAVISNNSLRADVVHYFDKRQINSEGFLEGLFEERGKTLDLLSHHVRWPPPRDPDKAWPWAGPLRLVTSREELRSDPALPNQLAMTGALATLTLRLSEGALDTNRELRAQIEAELANR